MNIFVTDTCPIKSAAYLDDKRATKMILESAQLLCTALRLHGISNDSLYRTTHANHPCSIWARQSQENYNWLLQHLEALLSRYNSVYGKVHATARLIPVLRTYKSCLPSSGLTEFANCSANQSLNISFKHMEVTSAYKAYLHARWKADKRQPTWNKCSVMPQSVTLQQAA